MNIIVDTSILRKDRQLKSADILFLKKLAKLDLIKLHFPWVIYKEITSQNFIEVNTVLNDTINNFRSINRKGSGEDIYKKLARIAKRTEVVQKDLRSSIENHWGTFIDETKSRLYDYNKDHGKKVMSSYFDGSYPFPSPKSRKDIPDAFIYESVKAISKLNNILIFITEDKNLFDSCSQLSNTKVFCSFEEFFKNDIFKPIDKSYKTLENFVDELIILKENQKLIEEIISKQLTEDILISGIYEELIFINNHYIPSLDDSGQSIGFDNFEISIDIANIKFVDEIFYLPIKVDAIVSIDYILYKDEYWFLAPKRNLNIVDDYDGEKFIIVEDFNIKFWFNYLVSKNSINKKKFNGEVESILDYELSMID